MRPVRGAASAGRLDAQRRARRQQRFTPRARAGMDDDRVTRAQQMPDHGGAHDAGADPADGRLRRGV